MKKKNQQPKEPELPKFGGFKPFAAGGGLADIKAKLDKEAEQRKAQQAAGKKPPPPPAAPLPKPKKPTAADAREDELSFHRMMSGVTPLDEAKAGRVGFAEKVEGRAPKAVDLRKKASEEAAEVLDHLRTLVDDVVRFEVTDDGKRVEGRRLDVSPSLLREVRRGVLPIDGRLDLHGLGAGEAREKVLEFLKTQRSRGERCVLIIHGKGEGILRGEMSAWLSQGKARDHVAAFATAREDDGGEGAVYVALRR